MKSDGPLQLVGARWSESDACGVELCGDEMACDGLSGFGEGGVAIVTEELSCGFVGTSDFEHLRVWAGSRVLTKSTMFAKISAVSGIVRVFSFFCVRRPDRQVSKCKRQFHQIMNFYRINSLRNHASRLQAALHSQAIIRI